MRHTWEPVKLVRNLELYFSGQQWALIIIKHLKTKKKNDTLSSTPSRPPCPHMLQKLEMKFLGAEKTLTNFSSAPEAKLVGPSMARHCRS